MSDLNVFTVTGRLTADAESKMVGQSTLVTFSIANNTGFGQYACTNFFKVNAWGKQASAVAQYLVKGKAVALSGTLQNKKWTGNDGIERSQWELTANGPITLLQSPQHTPDSLSPAPSFEDSYGTEEGFTF